MSNTTLTREDSAIYSRLAMWNGDEAYQYANTVDAEDIDYRAMLVHEKQGRGTDEDFVPLTPAQRVMGEVLMGRTLREWAEAGPRFDDTNGVAYNAGYSAACGYHD